MQDSPHSLKIKQEPFQLSPPSPLPPLHQGMRPLRHFFRRAFLRAANLNTFKHYDESS